MKKKTDWKKLAARMEAAFAPMVPQRIPDTSVQPFSKKTLAKAPKRRFKVKIKSASGRGSQMAGRR